MNTPPAPWAWWAVAFALGAPALVIGWVPLQTTPDTWPAWKAALALQPPLGWSQPPWRWWTCAWLHGSAPHQLGNLLALLAIAALGQQARLPGRAALAWVLAWPVTHLALLGHALPATYVGASGVLHAGVAILGTYHLLNQHTGARPRLGPLLLGGLALKVFMENPWQQALIVDPDSAITVAPWAHLAGGLAGCALALLTGLWPSSKQGSRPPSD